MPTRSIPQTALVAALRVPRVDQLVNQRWRRLQSASPRSKTAPVDGDGRCFFTRDASASKQVAVAGSGDEAFDEVVSAGADACLTAQSTTRVVAVAEVARDGCSDAGR